MWTAGEVKLPGVGNKRRRRKKLECGVLLSS